MNGHAMTRSSLAAASLIVLLGSAFECEAQVLEPPTRSFRGLFSPRRSNEPTRARHDLTLNASLIGGYDDNLTTQGAASDPILPHPSGYLGIADSSLEYRLTRGAQSFDINGRGYMNTYSNIGVRPTYGGDESARFRTRFGRRTTAEFSQSLRYDPYFSLGAFRSIQNIPGSNPESVATNDPDANPTNGLAESRSTILDGGVQLTRQWSRDTRTEGSYHFSRRTYDATGFDSNTQLVAVMADHSIARPLSLRGSYRYTDSTFTEQTGFVRPMQSHNIDGGFRYQRDLSRTRSITFAATAGGVHTYTITRITGLPRNTWTPSGYFSTTLDLGRTWALTGDYRRALTVLEGVTAQTFLAHAAMLSAGGNIGSRVECVLSMGYSNGHTGGFEAALGEYDSYTGTLQIQYALTRWWSTMVSVNRYQFRLNDAGSLALGIAPSMNRNAVRVGFVWSLPLIDSSARERERVRRQQQPPPQRPRE